MESVGPSRHEPLDTSASLFFRRGLDIALLAFFAGSALIFPIVFKGNPKWSGIYSSPLVLKESLSLCLIPVILALFLARAFFNGRLEYLRNPYNPFMAVFFVATIVWAACSPANELAIRDALLVNAHVLVFFVYAARFKDRRFRSQFYAVMVITGLLVAVAALLQANQTYLGFLNKSDGERNFMSSTFGHNNGVASFLMSITLHAVALIFAWPALSADANGESVLRQRLRRALGWTFLGGLSVLNVYLVLLSGTRAVWIGLTLALILLYACLLVFRRRLKHIRPVLSRSLPFAALFLLIVGAGAFLNWERFIKPRIQATDYITLVEGTRTRLYRIGVEMIVDRPLLGHGLASFKYLYPDYQADYFTRHPTTPLQPTEKHTDRTHNEFLQAMIEFGAVGGVAAAYFVLLHFGYALHVFRRWRNDRKTTLYLGAFAATVGTLINNILSFEFHVQPNAVLFLCGMALMAALDGRTRFRAIPLRGFARRPAMAWAMTALVLCAAFFASTRAAGWLVGDSLFALGKYSRNRAQEAAARGDRALTTTLLQAAAKYMEEGIRRTPYYGLYSYESAQVHLMLMSEKAPAEPGGPPVTPEQVYAILERAERTWRHLNIFHLKSRVRAIQLATVPAEPETRQRWISEAVENLRMAVAIYPRENTARYELGKLLYHLGRREEALTAFAEIRDRDTAMLRQRLSSEYVQYLQSGNVAEASAMTDIGYRMFEAEWPFAFARVHALGQWGRDARAALDVLDAYRLVHPQDARVLSAIVYLYEWAGIPEKAEEVLLKVAEGRDLDEETARIFIMLDNFHRRTNQGGRLPAMWEETLRQRRIVGPGAEAIVMMRLARLDLASGEIGRSLERFRRAYALNPTLKLAPAYTDTLNSTRLLPLLMMP